jgi:hypothetical protein
MLEPTSSGTTVKILLGARVTYVLVNISAMYIIRVARCFILSLEGLGLENFVIFYDNLECFTAI